MNMLLCFSRFTEVRLLHFGKIQSAGGIEPSEEKTYPLLDRDFVFQVCIYFSNDFVFFIS